MAEANIGDVLGSYQLDAEIGLGGAARLFRAHHVDPSYGENIFALKVLHGERAADPAFVARFRKEAYLLATLRHPNIVDTFESGIQDDQLYIAMEFVHGRDFGDILDETDGPLPEPLALHIIREVLDALRYAHDAVDQDGQPVGIVHLDIKPSNILVSYDGRVKLTDFGIAALRADIPNQKGDLVLGTKGYFAPEQLIGDQIDNRADIFGVGVVMYEALCGRQPFEAGRTSKVLKNNRRAAMPRPRKVNPKLSVELEEIILRALDRRPNKRFPSCQEMLDALDGLAPHPAGMALALGSFTRSLFVTAPDLMSGPWQRTTALGSIPPSSEVALCASDEAIRQTLATYLEPLGVMLRFHNSPARLVRESMTERAPRVIIVDVDDPTFTAAELLAFQVGSTRPVPVITVASSIEPRAVAVSDAVGAVEMLVTPLRREVTRAAIRRVLQRLRTAPSAAPPPSHTPPPMSSRILLVTEDMALATRLANDFKPWGYLVDIASTPDAALKMMDRSVYKGVIYDLFPADAVVPDLVTHLRGLPGVGIIPILYLKSSGPEWTEITMLERTALRPRETSSVVLASTLSQLRAVTHLGRTFRRLPTNARADLAFRGRTIDAYIENISRGGALVQTGHMPALHTTVSLTIHPEWEQPPFTLDGIVVRLELDDDPSSDEASVGVGIAFMPSERDAERALGAFVGILAARRAPLMTPPPRRFEPPISSGL